MTFDALLARLQEVDLLLDADPRFPSVTGLVVDGEVRGSRWSHPQAHEMFRMACRLRDHPDVLAVKLVSGKVTLVSRSLWPAVYAIGVARESWQITRLSKEAKTLLEQADTGETIPCTGDAVRLLESRLVVHSESVHTARGHHQKQIRSWQAWAKSVDFKEVTLSSADAKRQLERVVERLNRQSGASVTLPWQPAQKRRAASQSSSVP